MSLETATPTRYSPTCPVCGWCVITASYEQHVRDCKNATAGAAAVDLAARLPTLRSTKLGYGDQNLTFELDDDMFVLLECRSSGAFSLGDVSLFGALSMDEAAGLVTALADWRRDFFARRGQGTTPPSPVTSPVTSLNEPDEAS